MKSALQVILASILLVMASCQSAEVDYNDEIEVIEKYSELQTMIDSDESKVWVVNFWATSCPPCLKEMPHFKELEKDYQDKNLKILLVSLDRLKDLESRVYPYVKKHVIVPEVSLLEDQNYSSWNDEVDPSWYGALPATMIIKGNEKNFKFGIYKSYEELLDDVKEVFGD